MKKEKLNLLNVTPLIPNQLSNIKGCDGPNGGCTNGDHPANCTCMDDWWPPTNT
jgi:hypothetical protein